MTKREIIILCFFYSTVIFIGLVLVLKGEKADTTSNIIQAVTGIFSLFLTLGAVVYAYEAFQQQRRQNNFNEEQLAINTYEIQYSRALDLVFKQLEITKEKITGFQGNLNRLEHYKDIEQIPLYVKDFKPVIGNYNAMSHIIEQFLSRTTLHPHDQSYLYLFFTENISVDFYLVPVTLAEHFEKFGNTVKEFQEKAIDIYMQYERSNFIKRFPHHKDLPTKDIHEMISKRDNEKIQKYIQELIMLANGIYHSLDARKRLVNPNHQSKKFPLDDKK